MASSYSSGGGVQRREGEGCGCRRQRAADRRRRCSRASHPAAAARCSDHDPLCSAECVHCGVYRRGRRRGRHGGRRRMNGRENGPASGSIHSAPPQSASPVFFDSNEPLSDLPACLPATNIDNLNNYERTHAAVTGDNTIRQSSNNARQLEGRPRANCSPSALNQHGQTRGELGTS